MKYLILIIIAFCFASTHSVVADDETHEKIVEAIKNKNFEMLSKYIHPKCHKAYPDKVETSAFMNMLVAENPIPSDAKITKKDAPPATSHLYKINTFVVSPTYIIDVSWKQENGKSKLITLTFANEGDKTYLVTYISDYLLKKYKK